MPTERPEMSIREVLFRDMGSKCKNKDYSIGTSAFVQIARKGNWRDRKECNKFSVKLLASRRYDRLSHYIIHLLKQYQKYNIKVKQPL